MTTTETPVETTTETTTVETRPANSARPKWIGAQAPLIWLLIVAVIVLLASLPTGIMIGTADTPWRDVLATIRSAITGTAAQGVSSGTINIIWDIRIPRVILACIVGASLATVGTVMQATVRNPLADPYILGVSSGASVGAAAVIMFNAFGLRGTFGHHALSVAGFLGALMAMGVVYLIAHSPYGLSPTRLILGGIAAGHVFAAITSVLIFLGDPRAASGVLFWLLGGLGRAQWALLPVPLIALVITAGYVIYRSQWLNALSLGDDTARNLGVPVERFRGILFLTASLLTGVVVALSGAIGFVGLILPHVVRFLVGSDHRRVLILGIPVGAAFMVWADLIARTVVAPQVLPVGVITAGVGGPLFILLLIRRTRTQLT